MRRLLLGDEAIAQGALDAGLSGVYAYPGTPSTEITEFIQESPLAKERNVHRRWSTNEKTAMEAALGMSYMGKRALVCMKHVGLNVCADPFVNSAMTGTNGGIVVLVADDPSMHSSQDEQDSRFYAKFAMIPTFEPSSQQEAYDMMEFAFDYSEKIHLPVLMRVTTRMAHSRAVVEVKDTPRQENELNYNAKASDWVLLPAFARKRNVVVTGQQKELEQDAVESLYNKYVVGTDHSLGIIASGIGYNYVMECFKDCCPYSVLKISQYPLPKKLVRKMLEENEKVLVVEEGQPFIEDIIRGVNESENIMGRLTGELPRTGELNPDHVKKALGIPSDEVFAPCEDVTRKLTLHESDKALNISFSALNYGNERNGIYSYRMKGFEDEWIKLPMGQHSIRYTSLPGGTYTLEVKYASALSNSEEVIQLDIEVIPYFWKRWWFISGVFLLLAVAGAWLYRKRMEQVRRKTREQEAEKAMAPIVKALNESKDPKQLQQRIESILHIQKQYEDSYSKSAEENKEDTKKKNKPFMEKVIRVLEQNYSNSEFGVQELCEAMNMSRPLLSKHLNEEAGLPTTQFIRNYRLNIARQLLQESGGRNITEIAYSVGFNDPKYFTRCFTKLYGTSPSAIQ